MDIRRVFVQNFRKYVTFLKSVCNLFKIFTLRISGILRYVDLIEFMFSHTVNHTSKCLELYLKMNCCTPVDSITTEKCPNVQNKVQQREIEL